MIGHRIKRLRKERGLTQGELGKGIMSVSYISQIENNRRPIPDYLIEEVAERLNVSVGYLLGSEEKNKVIKVERKIEKALEALYHLRTDQLGVYVTELIIDAKEIPNNEELQLEIALVEIMYHLMQDQFAIVEEKLNAAKNLHFSKYPRLFYRLLRVLGMFKYKQGLHVESLDHYRQAYGMEESRKVTQDSTYLIYNMALSYLQLSDMQRTYYYAQMAHERFSELGNWFGLCESMMLLGIVHYNQKNYDKALNQYQKALNLSRKFSDSFLQAMTLHNIGLVYEEMGEYDEAYTCLNEALQIKKELNIPRVLVITLYSICEFLFNQEEYNDFIHHMDILQKTLTQCDYPLAEGKTLQLLGDYYRKVGQIPQCKKYYLKSVDCFTVGNLHLEAAELCYDLGKLFGDIQLFKQSAHLYHQYHKQLNKI